MSNKKEYRKKLLKELYSFSKTKNFILKSKLLVDKLKVNHLVNSSTSILLFFPNNKEPDIKEFIKYLLSQKKEIYFSIVKKKDLFFYRFLGNSYNELLTAIIKNKFNILEPNILNNKYWKLLEIKEYKDIDLLIGPCVGFNYNTKQRVGYGCGFYDIFLAQFKTYKLKKLLIGFDFQSVNNDSIFDWFDVIYDELLIV